MERQPEHWLYRLTPDEWLAAAIHELDRARAALTRGDTRKGLFEARRAAGMAWNGVLAANYDESYGRSYMDHLRALAQDPSQPEDIREHARRLLSRQAASELVHLGQPQPDLSAADAAAEILSRARDILDAASSPPN